MKIQHFKIKQNLSKSTRPALYFDKYVKIHAKSYEQNPSLTKRTLEVESFAKKKQTI